MTSPLVTRRRLIVAGAAATLVTPTLALAQTLPEEPEQEGVRHNMSSFSAQRWQDHFDSLGKAAIVADTTSRALHFWSGDGSDYRIYPTSVPRTDELTKRGYTSVVRKKVGPDWTPTQSQKERFGWEYVPPGPDNPMGSHAMYLGWPAYAIHGNYDTRKVGRQSSDGCIGLYNFAIEELFAVTPLGTQVRVI